MSSVAYSLVARLRAVLCLSGWIAQQSSCFLEMSLYVLSAWLCVCIPSIVCDLLQFQWVRIDERRGASIFIGHHLVPAAPPPPAPFSPLLDLDNDHTFSDSLMQFLLPLPTRLLKGQVVGWDAFAEQSSEREALMLALSLPWILQCTPTATPASLECPSHRGLQAQLSFLILRFTFWDFSYPPPTVVEKYWMENSTSKQLGFKLHALMSWWNLAWPVPSCPGRDSCRCPVHLHWTLPAG